MVGVVRKNSKQAYRRAKKKAKRQAHPNGNAPDHKDEDVAAPPADAKNDANIAQNGSVTTVDDVMHDIDELDELDDPAYQEFKNVFAKFQQSGNEVAKEEEKPEIIYEEDDIQDEEEEEETAKKLSRKARKAQDQMSVAQLKSLVRKPELVEWTDVDSKDPILLVNLKGTKNVVPVPTHWSLKREYLSSKRGVEKAPFALPKFIQETGIMEMRDAVLEKQADMTLKQKQRERVQGKVGKLDIDYTKYYDAFFRRQTKPELTRYGEVYYEGKEYETNMKHLRPGEMSEELRDALGMTPGAPPPWLINQQRHGPPPSYPSLKVPGVNAPPPPGGSWGYQPGQYGKPPTDDNGRPLFGGDFHGLDELQQLQQQVHPGEPVERGPWGVLRPEGESDDEDESEEEEESDEEEEEGDVDMSGIQTSMTGINSVRPSEIGGTESIGGEFTLRKQRKGIETEEPRGAPRSAYQVLPERQTEAKGFFGGEYKYDLDAAKRDALGDNSRKRKAGDVEVSIDVDQLGDSSKVDQEVLRKQYEAKKKAEAAGNWQSIGTELDDMIAAESRKRAKQDDKKQRR